MKGLDKYVGKCFHIDFEPKENSFKVFTIPTQHFYIESLGELTPERFELEIKKQNEFREQTRKNLIEVFEWKNQNKDENRYE
jgi:hypothetical protein